MAEQIKKQTVKIYENGHTLHPKDRISKFVLIKSLKIEDLARNVALLFGDGQYETILVVMRRMVDIVINRVEDGFAVDFGVCHINPSMMRAIPESNIKRKTMKNGAAARYSQTMAMHRGLRKVMLEVMENSFAEPVITHVEDMVTGEVDSLVTPLNNLCLRGSLIRIVGENPANGVRFIPVDNVNAVVEVPVDNVVINDSSTLLIIVPQMAEGDYFVEITTQFSSKGVILKEPRSYRFERILSVIAQFAP